jgi:hypothetical protein
MLFGLLRTQGFGKMPQLFNGGYDENLEGLLRTVTSHVEFGPLLVLVFFNL